MAADHDVERRVVQSDDPTLTPEANRLLTAELRRIVGRDEIEVPAGTPHRDRERHAGHSLYSATLVGNRLVIILTFVTAVVVGAVVSLATRSWWALVGALAVHALGTLLVGVGALQLTTEVEHASPQVAARLEAEGVRDPDKLLTELAAEYASAHP